MAIDADAAGLDLIKTGQQGNQYALARATGSNERDCLAGSNFQVQAAQHRPVRLIAEGHILEAYVATELLNRPGRWCIGDCRPGIHQVREAPESGDALGV